MTCPSEVYDFRIPLILGTLYVPETSYKGSIIQPLIEPDNSSLTTLQICITIPCETQQFWVFVSLHSNFGAVIPATKAGQLQVLVATDVAARGLHVKHLLGNPGNTGTRPEDPSESEGPWHVHKKILKELDRFPESTEYVEDPLFFFHVFSCVWGFGGMELMMGSPKNK